MHDTCVIHSGDLTMPPRRWNVTAVSRCASERVYQSDSQKATLVSERAATQAVWLPQLHELGLTTLHGPGHTGTLGPALYCTCVPVLIASGTFWPPAQARAWGPRCLSLCDGPLSCPLASRPRSLRS